MGAFGSGRAARRPWPAVLAADERGSTAIEYAMIAAIVAVMAIGGLQALGGQTGGLYEALEQINVAITDALG